MSSQKETQEKQTQEWHEEDSSSSDDDVRQTPPRLVRSNAVRDRALGFVVDRTFGFGVHHHRTMKNLLHAILGFAFLGFAFGKTFLALWDKVARFF